MLKQLSIVAIAALTFSGTAYAAGDEAHIEDHDFSFEGPFGAFDQNQLQRGLKVYTEVCSACHGLQYVPIRTLADAGGPHMPADQVRQYAKDFPVLDADANHHLYEPETGELRALKDTDHFPANTMQSAPDLSLMAKKRAGFHGPQGSGLNQLFKGMGGPEYIYSLLTGYHETPECAPEGFPGTYNAAFGPGGYPEECKIFEEVETTDADGETVIEKVEVGRKVPGSWIGMTQPLAGEDVTFDDETKATLEQEAEDVAAFLMWAAEPKMMARKQAGLTGIIFLTVLSVLLYLTNKRLWAPLKGKNRKA